MGVIYRGISCQYDEINGGKIKAKGYSDVLEFMAGDSQVMAGNSLNTICASTRNAMHGHNICSDTYKTTYVSFTTDLKVAEKFATADSNTDGYIYVIDISVLEALGVECSSQEAQINDHEFEVLVNLVDFDHLPSSAILEKIFVQV